MNLKIETRTAKTTDEDFPQKQSQAIADGRNFVCRVGHEECLHVGWFFTEIEATEHRSELMAKASRNKWKVTVNEICPL
jgi:hypothetical protein